MDICSAISEKHLRPFIHMIFLHKCKEVYLEFFKVIIKHEKQILKPNQNLTLKLLIMTSKEHKLLKIEKTKRIRRQNDQTSRPH